MNKKETQDYLYSRKLVWKSNGKTTWRVDVEEKDFYLRMNDFPDEQLYSVFNAEKELLFHLDDAPKSWKIEFDMNI